MAMKPNRIRQSNLLNAAGLILGTNGAGASAALAGGNTGGREEFFPRAWVGVSMR